MTRGSFDGVLRWYPASWRRRYGEELAALLEDTYGARAVPLRCRLSLLRAGSVERLRASGLLGASTPPSDGVRAGSLLVLWAWAVFMVAGAGFANLAENWVTALPAGSSRLPAAGYDVVYCAGLAGGVILLLAAGVCVPAFVRFLRGGGWPAIRRRLLLAAGVTVVTMAAVTAMAVWAHQLDSSQRNGGLWTYSLLAGVVALLITATIAAWTAAGSAAARRLELPARVVRYCGALAVALTLVMAALVGGTVTWWSAIASRAPWFLDGTAPGTAGTVAPLALVIVGTLMVLGLILAVIGARRAATSLRRGAEPPAR